MNKFHAESQFKAGQRVQTHPATDAWMQGDRFGVVLCVHRSGVVRVLMDVSKRERKFFPHNLIDAS